MRSGCQAQEEEREKVSSDHDCQLLMINATSGLASSGPGQRGYRFRKEEEVEVAKVRIL